MGGNKPPANLDSNGFACATRIRRFFLLIAEILQPVVDVGGFLALQFLKGFFFPYLCFRCRMLENAP